MSTSAAGVESPRIHGHPPLVRRLARWGIGISAASALGLLAVPLRWSLGVPHWILLAAGLASVLACLKVAVAIDRHADDTVEACDRGLRLRSPRAPEVFLPWHEVASVEPQQLMQRLVVSDAEGRRRIPLEFHLERFGELRREVLERAAHR